MKSKEKSSNITLSKRLILAKTNKPFVYLLNLFKDLYVFWLCINLKKNVTKNMFALDLLFAAQLLTTLLDICSIYFPLIKLAKCLSTCLSTYDLDLLQ